MENNNKLAKFKAAVKTPKGKKMAKRFVITFGIIISVVLFAVAYWLVAHYLGYDQFVGPVEGETAMNWVKFFHLSFGQQATAGCSDVYPVKTAGRLIAMAQMMTTMVLAFFLIA